MSLTPQQREFIYRRRRLSSAAWGDWDWDAHAYPDTPLTVHLTHRHDHRRKAFADRAQYERALDYNLNLDEEPPYQ